MQRHADTGNTFELVVHTLDLVVALGLVADPPQGAASQSLRMVADLTVAGGGLGRYCSLSPARPPTIVVQRALTPRGTRADRGAQ